MKIAIVTAGTRGDVVPYVAVGKALAARGHEVWVAADPEYVELIRGHGLGYRKMGESFRALMATDLGRAWLASADSPFEYARRARELFVPLQDAWCADADAAVEGADAVAFYLLGVGALHAAERRKLPAAALTPWPVVPSRELLMSPAAWLDRAPGFLKRGLGHLQWWVAFRDLNEAHLSYRERVGLARYRARDPVHFVLESGVPILHLFSELVLPRPSDWQPHHHVAGFALLDGAAYEPPPDLAAFLEEPAIYVGFGSMTGVDHGGLCETVNRAIRIAGVRAVVSRGWAGLDLPASPSILPIDEVSHAWLFPRVSAVVHHGGAGTLAAGLRAGKPSVVCAFFGDQPFWGRINQAAGCGPPALLRKKLTAEALAAAIRAADQHRPRAQAMGEALRKEDGAARAADLLSKHFAR